MPLESGTSYNPPKALDPPRRSGRRVTDGRAPCHHCQDFRSTGGHLAVGRARQSHSVLRQNAAVPHGFHTKRPFRTAHPAAPRSPHQRTNAHEIAESSKVGRSPCRSAIDFLAIIKIPRAPETLTERADGAASVPLDENSAMRER